MKKIYFCICVFFVFIFQSAPVSGQYYITSHDWHNDTSLYFTVGDWGLATIEGYPAHHVQLIYVVA